MKEGNNLLQKSFTFATRVVEACQYLVRERREYVLSKQLLRSGTSIGANCEEAMGGQSTADFYAKITIAYKEARETSYWIRLLQATGYLSRQNTAQLLEGVEELLRIIGTIQLRTKAKSQGIRPAYGPTRNS